MEFTYRISEPEYMKAAKLRLKGTARVRIVRVVMFWVLF
jgi:hypothetical protein